MIGTVEVFDVTTGQLVFSDGFAAVAQPKKLMEQADYIVVRRYGPQHIPRVKIVTMSLNEFFHWHLQGFNAQEAFTDISPSDMLFLY